MNDKTRYDKDELTTELVDPERTAWHLVQLAECLLIAASRMRDKSIQGHMEAGSNMRAVAEVLPRLDAENRAHVVALNESIKEWSRTRGRAR